MNIDQPLFINIFKIFPDAEVNTEEIQDVELLISHLSNQQKLLSAQTQVTISN